jgi:STE24 endopeptidase
MPAPDVFAAETPSLDPERQVQARRYAKISRRLWAAGTAVAALYLIIWLAFDLAAAAARSPLLAACPWPLTLIAVAASLGVPYILLSLPLGFYQGFVLPHRFGISTQTLGSWVSDQVRGAALGAMIGTPLLLGLYALIRAQPQTWWAWAALGNSLVGTVLSALAPVLLLPLFYKQAPLGEAYATLVDRLQKLAHKAGAEVRGTYTIDLSRRTLAANAALTGLGRTRRILLGDTLFNNFSTEEIESVVAHELGHHVHGDIGVLLGFETALNFAGLYLASLALRWSAAAFGWSGLADPAGLPALALVIGAFDLVSMPLANAFSRWRERMADQFALQLAGHPAAFASAMTRLANQNLAEADPEPWVVAMFYSHPPLRSRIQMAGNSGAARLPPEPPPAPPSA